MDILTVPAESSLWNLYRVRLLNDSELGELGDSWGKKDFIIIATNDVIIATVTIIAILVVVIMSSPSSSCLYRNQSAYMLSRVDVRAKLLCDRVQPHQHLENKTMVVILRVKDLAEEEEYNDDEEVDDDDDDDDDDE